MADYLQQAIAAIKSGDRTTGKRLLIDEVLRTNPRDEIAWLWMTQTVESDDERMNYLRNVLKINPHNERARQGMAAIQQKQSHRGW